MKRSKMWQGYYGPEHMKNFYVRIVYDVIVRDSDGAILSQGILHVIKL
jgi:hypothetical protein